MVPKKILFVSYGGGHVHMLAPLILEVQKDERLEPHTIGLTIAAKVYREQYHIVCKGAKDYISEADTDTLRYGSMLLKQMQSKGNHVEDVEETVAYLGTSFADLVSEEGTEQDAWEAYETKGRAAFLPLTFMRRVFDKIQPDLVVTTNSPRGEKAAQTVAKERNIRSILLTDLFNCPPEYNFFADTICVLSESAKKNLITWNGTPESKIAITGNPAFDETISKAGPIDYTWRAEKLGFENSDLIFLWADQPSRFDSDSLELIPRSNQEIVDTLNQLSAASREEGLKLLIRSHPSQDVHLYREWSRRHDVLLANDFEINQLINAVDILGSSASTVLLQGYYIGRTIFQLSLGGGKKVINIQDWKKVFVADRDDQIRNALSQAGRAARENSEPNRSTISTPRVVKLIYQNLGLMH